MQRELELQPFREAEPKISVITVAKDHGRFLRKNIESVLAQNYFQFEHLIFDSASQDETVSVLRQFPHLRWVSEPLESLAVGCLRGAEQAEGEILCWLRADCSLATDVFSEVAEILKSQPLVIGGYGVVDESEGKREVIRACSRNFYDVLKYWVYHSAPPQPALFVRRDVLALLAADAPLFDLSLTSAADFDLMLRLAERFGLSATSEKVYAYGRATAEETAAREEALRYREASRVFRKFGFAKSRAERKMSLIIACDQLNTAFEQSLRSCSRQSFADFEVLAWGRGLDAQQGAELTRLMSDVAGLSNDGRYRSFLSPGGEGSFKSDFKQLIEQVRAPLFLSLQPGQELTENSVLELSNTFEQDSLSLLLICAGNEGLYQALSTTKDGVTLFNLQAIFEGALLPKSFAARTIAAKEVLDCDLSASEPLALREWVLLSQYKAWSVQLTRDEYLMNLPEHALSRIADIGLSQELLQAKLIDRVASVRADDPFAELRSEFGFIIEFPPETVQAAREFLARADGGAGQTEM